MVYILAAMMMMMLLPSFVFIVFSEDHFLATRGILAHINVWVAKVVVVAPGGLVPLMVERAFLILDAVSRRSWGDGLVALVRAQVVLLS